MTKEFIKLPVKFEISGSLVVGFHPELMEEYDIITRCDDVDQIDGIPLDPRCAPIKLSVLKRGPNGTFGWVQLETSLRHYITQVHNDNKDIMQGKWVMWKLDTVCEVNKYVPDNN